MKQQPDLAAPLDRSAPRKLPLPYLLGIFLVGSLTANVMLGFIVHSQDQLFDKLMAAMRASQDARMANRDASGGIPTIDITALRSFCESADKGFKIPTNILDLCPTLED